MKFDLVIFDLDGTVLDTLADLSNAVNSALARNGYPVRTLDEARRFIGNGVAKLIERALPESADAETRARVLSDFKDCYREHVNDNTHPYPGIRELLSSLRSAGIRVGINSNKYDAALQELCRLHFDGLYDVAAGECERTPKKPDPTAALRMMAEFAAAPERTLYVGDSAVDLATARNAGCAAGWVAWGFRRREEMEDLRDVPCFDRAEELRSYLLN